MESILLQHLDISLDSPSPIEGRTEVWHLGDTVYTIEYHPIVYLETREAIAAHRQAVKRDPSILNNGVIYAKCLTPEEEAIERQDKDRQVIIEAIACLVLYAVLCLGWWIAFGDLVF